ncbi:MAG TPA: TolC family protein [Candidatus Angelobacter sp.]|nr:TolC family protein [Candidatus Angelobacter sp.]
MHIRNVIFGLLLCCALDASAQVAPAQFAPAKTPTGNLLHRPLAPAQLQGPSRVDEFIVDGKLRLSLEDAILLTLLNNSDVNVNRAQFDLSQFAVQRAHSPFDPLFVAGFAPTRSVSPSDSSLNGASTLSTLNQTSSAGYSQQFITGTNLSVSLSSTRFTTNSSFATVNPSFTSGLTFSLSQPLLRHFGIFANRAPIIVAQRGVRQSRANFEAQLNDALQTVINQYWDVVQARKTLEVLKKSLELAEASYQRDKRALELGALPPLDIYRSESQVAQRKVPVIQAEFSLKQVENTLRQTIGADLDARAGALDLELTDTAETGGKLEIVDLQESLAGALKNRPEIDAQNQQLAIDDTNAKLAVNNLRPDLNLAASYTSNGLGGIVFDNSGNLVSNGGFGDSLSQLGGFSFPTYGVTLQMRFPVRNSSAAADLGTALVSKRRSLYQMRGLQQTISTQVKNAVHDLEQAELVITAAQDSRELAAKNLAAEERKYQLGAETIFFVLDAQNQLSQAEQSLVQAQISYQKALAEVDHATGSLLAKHKLIPASATP